MKPINNLILIILISFNISCNRSDSANTKNFEDILGETNTKYLNEIIQDFELFLDTNYSDKNIELKYIAYLNDLSKHKITNNWQIDSLKTLKYKSSTLFAKFDTVYADTIWYDGDMINYKLKDDDLLQAEIPIRHGNKALNIDSLINNIKTKPFRRMISESRFYMAIDSLKVCDSLMNIIGDIYLLGGNDLRFRLADGILYVKPDFSDYFVKRIVVMETADYK